MSVPPQLMQQAMAGGQPGAGPPGMPPGAAPPSGPREVPPAAAPMNNPSAKQGQRTAAMSKVEIAVTMLSQALPDLGTGSAEHQAVLKVLNQLSRITAKRDSSDLVPAQVMQMVRGMPQMGGGTPVQQELMRQMAMQRMQAARGGGAAGGAGAPQLGG